MYCKDCKFFTQLSDDDFGNCEIVLPIWLSRYIDNCGDVSVHKHNSCDLFKLYSDE